MARRTIEERTVARRRYVPSGRDITRGLILLVTGQAVHEDVWRAILEASSRPGGDGPMALVWIGDVVSLVGLGLLVAGVFADDTVPPTQADS